MGGTHSREFSKVFLASLPAKQACLSQEPFIELAVELSKTALAGKWFQGDFCECFSGRPPDAACRCPFRTDA